MFDALKNRLVGDRPKNCKSMTLREINEMLDELNQSPDKREVLRRMVFGCSAEEQKWLIRVILKNTRLGMGDAMVLKCVHPDAQELYNMTSNLRRVCQVLRNPSVRLQGSQCTLSLFEPFVPMLASRESIEETMEHMPACKAIVEPKLDGERIQLHTDLTTFRYWSRRGFEYTYLYGRTADEGSLTPHIAKDCFKEGTTDVILDGEMLAYDPITKDFMPFGTLKPSADSAREETFSKVHDPRPCFVIFDILYLDGQSLIHRPLKERKELLHQHVNPNDGHLIIIKSTEIDSKEKLYDQMDQALSDKLEGIIVKDLESTYAVGKRLNSWIKLKPEYVDSLCDDLDLLIIGGSYGRGIGGTPGSISTFVVGVKDDVTGKFKVLGRVASGISISELDRLRARLAPHFIPFDPKSPVEWVQIPLTANERPDVIINHPSKSIVIQVKATQIIESNVYPLQLTLRHPRYVRERQDKSPDATMTVTELQDLYRISKGNLARKQLSQLERPDPSKKRAKVLRGKFAKASLGAAFVSAAGEKVDASSDIFDNLEFCKIFTFASRLISILVVCYGEDDGLDKVDLEKKIMEFGGMVTQNPVPGKTFAVISGKAEGLRVNNVKKQGNLDIVKSKWIHDCIQAGRRLILNSDYIIFATPKTEQMMKSLTDEFADSYVDELTDESIRSLLLKDKWPKPEKAQTGSEQLVEEIKLRYLPDLI